MAFNPGDMFASVLKQATDQATSLALAGMANDQTAANQAKALQAQKDAVAAANTASLPAIDSESSRAAADVRRRKLTLGSNFGIGMPSQLGAPPVGYRMLAGE